MAVFLTLLCQRHFNELGAGRVFTSRTSAQHADLRPQISTRPQWIAQQIVGTPVMRHD
jgi:hypothetical protein